MIAPANSGNFRPRHASPPDIHILTSGGQTIPMHSSILASASPVLDSMIPHRTIKILGAPHDSVVEFLRLLAAGKTSPPSHEEAAAMNLHGVPILALAHAYRIGWLKARCEAAVGDRVGPADALDVMKLAQLCDAPRLRLRCLAVAANQFAAVQQTEGWRFVQRHDPRLELEVLQFMAEGEQRRRRWRRERADQEVFRQLSVAMRCLEHVCVEGCMVVGPNDGEAARKRRGPCEGLRTCESLQLLLKHFATCGKKGAGGGGCLHCRRMWQIFRLHSAICERGGCKVPLCRQFKVRVMEEGNGKGDDATWRLLVRKVVLAGNMSSLAARKTPEWVVKMWGRCKRNK